MARLIIPTHYGGPAFTGSGLVLYTTRLDITAQIAAGTNFTVTASGVGYTHSGDNGDLLANAGAFNGAGHIFIFLNGVRLIRGVNVTWQTQTSFQLDTIVDNGDEIVILS